MAAKDTKTVNWDAHHDSLEPIDSQRITYIQWVDHSRSHPSDDGQWSLGTLIIDSCGWVVAEDENTLSIHPSLDQGECDHDFPVLNVAKGLILRREDFNLGAAYGKSAGA